MLKFKGFLLVVVLGLLSGQLALAQCPKGTQAINPYNPAQGCVDCDKLYYQGTKLSSLWSESKAMCACTNGKETRIGGVLTNCVDCPPYTTAINNACVRPKCAAGSFVDLGGVCQQCPAGMVVSETGTSCKTCPSGTVASQDHIMCVGAFPGQGSTSSTGAPRKIIPTVNTNSLLQR